MAQIGTVRRGEIYWINQSQNTYRGQGKHLQDGDRPAIIVSNDKANASAPVVEVVFLTSSPKTDLPTHVTIRSARVISTALCEQISSVGVEAIGNYIGTCTAAEMEAIENCLLISLGMDFLDAEDPFDLEEGEVEEDPEKIESLARITALERENEELKKIIKHLEEDKYAMASAKNELRSAYEYMVKGILGKLN